MTIRQSNETVPLPATLTEPSEAIGAEAVNANDSTPNQPSRWLALLRFLWRTPAVMTGTVLLVIVVFFSILYPTQFLSPFNLQHLIIDYSTIVILAVGVTFAMTSGQFDLSVGSVLVLSAVIGVKVMTWVGGDNWWVVFIGLVATLLTGTVVGFLNGWLITKARVPSIIVTLGSGTAAAGIAYIITGGQDLGTVPETLVNNIGFGQLLGFLPGPVAIALLIVVISSIVLSMTRFGLYTAAVGSNSEAARRAGISVEWVVIKLYLISGSLAGVAAFIGLARFHSTTIGGHGQDGLTALLGVVLGGTSLFGGSGTVLGSTVGVFIPGVLANGLILMDIFPYWQQVIVGVALIAVVYADLVKRRSRDS